MPFLTKLTRGPLLKSTLLIVSAACLSWEARSEWVENTLVDKSNVSQIAFSITADQLSDFSQIIDIKSLNTKISSNLAEWHYPIHSGDTTNASHRMSASVGAITTDNTPVGFSFSQGNSDPRAAGFQKSQVLPITCQLSSLANPRQQAIYKTTVNAYGFSPSEQTPAEVLTKLTNEISTVCFNLLDELDLPTEKASPASVTTTVNKPGWMPNVSVEVKNAPAQPAAIAPAPVISTPASAVQNETKPATVQAAPPKVRIEDDVERKQIIIHNQGTPLMLEMGHQRR
ncbi:hypothetical protein JCM14076_17080 [Methylosoma difficile]